MKLKYSCLVLLAGTLHFESAHAYRPLQDGVMKEATNNSKIPAWLEAKNLMKSTAGCKPAEAYVDLDINNVRARMMHAGTMWWDGTGNAMYEVPKGSRKHSLFAGSCWIAGIDAENQTKVCAQMFRTDGEDYWPGPIDRITKDVAASTCLAWDKIWKINAVDIEAFRALVAGGDFTTASTDPRFDDIVKWPAVGNVDARGRGNVSIFNDMVYSATESNYAEFVDVDGDNLYDWRKGDYPAIKGDQYLWWIFNDKGNTKQNTGSTSIGMEVQTSAFAFSTRDVVNDMTFVNYRLINRGNLTLNETYMATFTDADLGYAFDDYVGCDTASGLGILYNGNATDGTGEVSHYGNQVPMVGVDYFIGPRRDYVDPTTGRDTFELLQMQVFDYFNNTSTGSLKNPSTRFEYYNYMTGKTADGRAFQNDYKQPGTPALGTTAGTAIRFVFPGDPTDPTMWSECQARNAVGDRRFIHSAGPFTLKPGVKNDMTIGMVWVADVGGCGSQASFDRIRDADRLAQDAFDRGFILPEGPQAPRVTFRELDRRLIVTLTNDSTSNNYNEGYGTDLSKQKYRVPITAAVSQKHPDSLYKFQGYRFFQVKNKDVTPSSIFNEFGEVNTDLASEIFQCDIQDSITTIRNIEEVTKEANGNVVYKYPLKVSGNNQGLQHSFMITQDAFAKGSDKQLVNYKTYYFLALAYGYNNFRKFDPAKPDSTASVLYIESSKNGDGTPLRLLTAMPNPANSAMGNVINSDYGTGVIIKRLEGIGAGKNDLQIDEETENLALTGPNFMAPQPVYKEGRGPVDIKVIDPVLLPGGNWELYITGTNYTGADSTKGIMPETGGWKLVHNGNESEAIYSERNLASFNDQIVSKYGLSINIGQAPRPGDDPNGKDGYITSDITFADITMPWLAGVNDADNISNYNWIRSGAFEVITPSGETPPECDYDDYRAGGLPIDSLQNYERMLANNLGALGSWSVANVGAKMRSAVTNSYACDFTVFPANYSSLRLNNFIGDNSLKSIKRLNNVDIVFTNDKSKWSRCIVVETNHDRSLTGGYSSLAEGNVKPFELRSHLGWNGETDENGHPIYSNNTNDSSMSWFPGYAIDQETGMRLNIFFGEDSWLQQDNGRDMIWNPTSTTENIMQSRIFGGRHYVYVTNQAYDSCQTLKRIFKENATRPSIPSTLNPYQTVRWVGMPRLADNHKLLNLKDGLIPTETRIRFRVSQPYQHTAIGNTGTLKNNGYPLYSFNTDNLKMDALTDVKNKYHDDKQALLDRIKVVPNPYYGYANHYEQNRFDTRVRIINLPKKASVKIYSIDGTLVRNLSKDNDAQSYLDWDIKNTKGLPIASGMYLIHVNADGIGETVVKWFGMMRPIDIVTF